MEGCERSQCVCECVSMCVCVCGYIRLARFLPVVLTRLLSKHSESSRDPQKLESVQVRLPGCWPALFAMC